MIVLPTDYTPGGDLCSFLRIFFPDYKEVTKTFLETTEM
jgi:hypothetical protein